MGAGSVLIVIQNRFICGIIADMSFYIHSQYNIFLKGRRGNILSKGILLILLVLIISEVSAYAGKEEEYSIIEKDHKKGLINKNGRVIIPPEYEDLGWTNGGTLLLENVIGFKKGGLWGILNTKNEKITEPLYVSLARLNENWIVASKKLPYNSSIVYGVINAKGHAEIAFQYHMLRVHNSKLIASVEESGKYFFGVLDEKAKPVIPIKYDRIEVISDDLYEVTSEDDVAVFSREGKNISDFSLDSVQTLDNNFVQTFRNGKRGLISSSGDFVISPKYKNIVFEGEKIRAEKFRQWHAFDDTNQLLATYAYDDVVPMGDDIYKVTVGKAQALIHQSDSMLTSFSNFEIQDQLGKWVSVKQNGKSGILHFDGKMFLEPSYDSIRFVKNLFIVKHKLNGKRGWSLINEQGEIITDQIYEEITWLGDSYYKAKRGDYWGVINDLGKEIIYCKYDSIKQYTQGKLLVEFLHEEGILNLDGNWEILPQNKDIEIVDPIRYLIRSPYGSYVAFYPDTKDFTAEYFLYKHGNRYLEKTLDNKFGLLDEEGDRVIKPGYDEISELQQDSIYYAKSENGHSFITKSGQVMIEDDDRFQAIHDMTEEFIGVMIDDQWGFVDINGKLRISNQYDNVGLYNEGLAPIKLLGRWGYIDKRENIIVQPRYDSVYHFLGGICEVIRKGKYGLINAKGEITLECEYDSLYRLKTGGFITSKENKKGLVGENGRLLILPRFDNMVDLDNGFVIASRKGKYGVMSSDGLSIIPMIYEDLKYDRFNNVYLAASSPEWIYVDIP